MSKDNRASKDAALRAVGCTIVNFHKPEHNLKLAARLGPVEGTLPRVQRDIEERIEGATTMTSGPAIHAWLGVIAAESLTNSYTRDLFDNTVRTTFSLVADGESQEARGAAVNALLEARNKLVHADLAQFACDSSEECERLVGVLR